MSSLREVNYFYSHTIRTSPTSSAVVGIPLTQVAVDVTAAESARDAAVPHAILHRVVVVLVAEAVRSPHGAAKRSVIVNVRSRPKRSEAQNLRL